MFESIYLITLLPLIGFLVNGLLGKKINNEKLIGTIGCLAVGIPFVIASSFLYSMLTSPQPASITQTLFT